MSCVFFNHKGEVLDRGLEKQVVQLGLFQPKNCISSSMAFQNRYLTNYIIIVSVKRGWVQAAPRAKGYHSTQWCSVIVFHQGAQHDHGSFSEATDKHPLSSLIGEPALLGFDD